MSVRTKAPLEKLGGFCGTALVVSRRKPLLVVGMLRNGKRPAKPGRNRGRTDFGSVRADGDGGIGGAIGVEACSVTRADAGGD